MSREDRLERLTNLGTSTLEKMRSASVPPSKSQSKPSPGQIMRTMKEPLEPEPEEMREMEELDIQIEAEGDNPKEVEEELEEAEKIVKDLESDNSMGSDSDLEDHLLEEIIEEDIEEEVELLEEGIIEKEGVEDIRIKEERIEPIRSPKKQVKREVRKEVKKSPKKQVKREVRKEVKKSSRKDIENPALLRSIEASYMSNGDLFVDLDSVPERAKKLYFDLLSHKDYMWRAAILLAHLHTATFTGANSYTLREAIINNNEYDIGRLHERNYVWPEVYNNKLFDAAQVDRLSRFEHKEIEGVHQKLVRGEPLPMDLDQGMICYTTQDIPKDTIVKDSPSKETCRGIRPCPIMRKREIMIPGTHNSKAVAYCFAPEVIYDILLTEKTPKNPETSEVFPKHLTTQLYDKYKVEINMRAYYLESKGNSDVTSTINIVPTHHKTSSSHHKLSPKHKSHRKKSTPKSKKSTPKSKPKSKSKKSSTKKKTLK
jgi:hypothetical protein